MWRLGIPTQVADVERWGDGVPPVARWSTAGLSRTVIRSGMARRGTVGKAAPTGRLETYQREDFASGGVAHPLYRKGTGPCVIVLTEVPGITPMVLGFADTLIAMGCTAVLPDLFGEAGRDPMAMGAVGRQRYVMRTFAQLCISREFTLFATGRSSRVVDWLRALAHREHDRCGGPGVGVVGMCVTGGFGLALAVDPVVVAPVLSQPALPVPPVGRRRTVTDIAPTDLDVVARRCQRGELDVLGLRFDGDTLVPGQRFSYLSDRLGDRFLAIELDQADGNQAEPSPKHHSVLTGGLVDQAGSPTRHALDQVLEFLGHRLLGEVDSGPTDAL